MLFPLPVFEIQLLSESYCRFYSPRIFRHNQATFVSVPSEHCLHEGLPLPYRMSAPVARASNKKPDSWGTSQVVPVSDVWEIGLKAELICFNLEYLSPFWHETPWFFSDNVFKYTPPLRRDKITHAFSNNNTHSNIWQRDDIY